jgi:UDP-N-acetylmuramate dehydrogenase
MDTVQKAFKKIKISCPFVFNEPLHLHTSFKIGGKALVFARPHTLDQIKEIFSFCLEKQVSYYILGQGANVLVSDYGLKGVVISLEDFSGMDVEGTLITALSGTPLNSIIEKALDLGLKGLDSFYKMPGSAGGSIWMNARCYDTSLADVLEYVEIIDSSLNQKRVEVRKEDFAYKYSPFQKQKLIIVKGAFRLEKGERDKIKARMDEIYEDRIKKGHFLYPCAGSVFKNNRFFGMPSGKLIDSLGLKGFRIGGAQILAQHANIIVNTGKATAKDVADLIQYVKQKVFDRYGFELEEEIIFLGEEDKIKQTAGVLKTKGKLTKALLEERRKDKERKER